MGNQDIALPGRGGTVHAGLYPHEQFTAIEATSLLDQFHIAVFFRWRYWVADGCHSFAV